MTRDGVAGVAIRARNLGKFFTEAVEIDGVARPREAWRTLMRIAGVNVRAGDNEIQLTVAGAGQVLRGVSFDVRWGSAVCLAGASGAGKSVLLQMLAGVIPPTSGVIEFYGPVSQLLSAGDNIVPVRTAHENIHDAAHARGASSEEAARYAADVIDFAGLQGVEHAPIRTYSTGMVLRLSVALVLCARPSILLLDDILAVGDIAFQQACVDRLHELRESGCTMVAAFSDPALVRLLATRTITLGGGGILGDTADAELQAADRAAGFEWRVCTELPEDDVIAVRSVDVREVLDVSEGPTAGRGLEVSIGYNVKVPGVRCRPRVSVSALGETLFASVYPEAVPVDRVGPITFSVRVPTDVLPGGGYTISLNTIAMQGSRAYSSKADIVALTVARPESPLPDPNVRPLLTPALAWEIERVARVV